MLSRMAILVAAIVLFSPADAQQIRGRVVDPSGRGLDGVSIVLRSLDGRLIASGLSLPPDGAFRLAAPAGNYELRFERLGFAVLRHELRPLRSDTMLGTLRLRAESIEVSELQVPLGSTAATAIRRLDATALTSFQERGWDLRRAIDQLPDVQIRSVDNGLCFESALAPGSSGRDRPPCDPLVLVLDDTIMPNPSPAFAELQIARIDRVEYIPPKEAVSRYGADAARHGALVIHTRK